VDSGDSRDGKGRSEFVRERKGAKEKENNRSQVEATMVVKWE
jgi:hypothetical protein